MKAFNSAHAKFVEKAIAISSLLPQFAQLGNANLSQPSFLCYLGFY